MMRSPDVARPSSLACVECRQKHLKCSGTMPVCERCSSHRLMCTYTPSRRGRTPRTKRSCKRLPNVTRYIASTTEVPTTSTRTCLPTDGFHQSTIPLTSDISPETHSSNHVAESIAGPIGAAEAPAPFQLLSTDREHLINLFYTYFHPAHPLLVPRTFFAAQQYPYFLELVICLAGQHYAQSECASAAAALYDATALALAQPDEPTIARVQALVIYAIVLHARHKPKEAEAYIERAASIAITLGVNHATFAREHAMLDSVKEESLRRTWWEAYIVDAYLAALHRRSSFRSDAADQQPCLPCSEALFEVGKCDLDPPSLELFKQRVFADGHHVDFSPYAYRIEAVQIVARVLALAASNDAQPDDIQAVDNAIAGWKYNLPTLKADVVDPSGDVDPMLFQAHLFIHCASIFLHFPRSDLPSTVPSAAEITCAKGYKKLTPTSTQHTIKAISASKEISNLAAIPWPIEKHSPFFTCGLILGCVVQLAAASVHLHSCGLNCLQQHRDRVILMLGALRCLGQKWSLAQNAVNQLRVVADAIFTARDAPSIPVCDTAVRQSGLDAADLSGGFSWFDLFSSTDPQHGLVLFDSG